jgi:1-deoxy-D-xylulose-5-phosphate reductoisomerase
LARRIAILGSTGSIGCNALEVIEHLGGEYRAIALSANKQTDKLLEQVRRHRPEAVAVAEDISDDVLAALQELNVVVYRGADGIVQLVQRHDVDVVLAAIVGAAGVPATFAAVQAGKAIALANKESLVVAGALIMPEARKRDVTIIPVDSEHSAVFQAMKSGRRNEIKRVILTASGGPFRNWSLEQIKSATPEQALAHPTWRMGAKVTVDSASMFNKGLELIEACWLFDLSPDMVQIVVHPQSIVHSMVEFVDGSTLAQLSPPDMRTPIQYALTYPDRLAGVGKTLDFTAAQELTFEPPDPARFPALDIAYDVARRGGTLGAVMNAANEIAVDAFINGKIGFAAICEVVALTIGQHRVQGVSSMDDLLAADRWARSTARSLIEKR